LPASDPRVDHPQIPVFLDRNRQDDAVRPENRVDRTRFLKSGVRGYHDRRERVGGRNLRVTALKHLRLKSEISLSVGKRDRRVRTGYECGGEEAAKAQAPGDT
jgi:hypothetical protein